MKMGFVGMILFLFYYLFTYLFYNYKRFGHLLSMTCTFRCAMPDIGLQEMVCCGTLIPHLLKDIQILVS